MAQWNSQQYLKFEKERTQPAIDLAARIPLEHPQAVLDIGCGPGNSTHVLAQRFPEANILGVDQSLPMLEQAARQYPDLSFRQLDAHTELPTLGQRFDVVFSNACIQWVPDHPRLLREMMALLRPGGVLAVQVPMNQREPIHQIIAQTVAGAAWKDKFPHPRIFYTLTQEEYFDRLAELTPDFTVWETIYGHRMPSHDSIMEWYKGTGLRPYLADLSEQDAARFEREIAEQVALAYPLQANGEILFRFPRFFFLAVKQ